MTLFWRITFFLAVLGNLLFFVWSQGYFGRLEDGREPQRMTHQIDPEKLRIIDVPPPPDPAEKICRLMGGQEGLPVEQAQRLQSVMTASAAADKLSSLQLGIHPVDRPAQYWVLIPPLASKVLVDKKMQELRQMGVKDAKPLLTDTQASDRFAILLGSFSSQTAAQSRLAALKQRGVRTAIVQSRIQAAETARVDIRATRDDLQKHLPVLLDAAGLSGIALDDCPNES